MSDGIYNAEEAMAELVRWCRLTPAQREAEWFADREAALADLTALAEAGGTAATTELEELRGEWCYKQEPWLGPIKNKPWWLKSDRTQRRYLVTAGEEMECERGGQSKRDLTSEEIAALPPAERKRYKARMRQRRSRR